MNASIALAAGHAASVPLAVDDNKVTPGLLGFVVFAALGAAVWFLLKSMNKHLGKVKFEVEPEPDGRPAKPKRPRTIPQARPEGPDPSPRADGGS